MKPNRKGVKDLGKAFKLFERIANRVYDRGGDDEVLCLIEQESVLDKIVDVLMGAKKLALKNLKLVADSIAVKAEQFTKDSFFGKNGPANLYFGSGFNDSVLAAIPATVPAWNGSLRKCELTNFMTDSEILSELGQPEPFTPAEFAAIVTNLISCQPKGQAGMLLTNGYTNIFYVKFADGRVVPVGVYYWRDRDNTWILHAYFWHDNRWDCGSCVFSRS